MLGPARFRILEEPLTYTGAELRPHWGLERTGIYGPLLVAFTGSCHVATESLVDMEDRLARDHIRAAEMLHVIGEFHGMSLEAGVFCQRLFMACAERLLSRAGLGVSRRGDDLMVGEEKLSVSIATVSPVSVLIHWGMNIDETGAPVAAAGLARLLGWQRRQVLSFAKELLAHYIEELEEIRIAQCKVRPVGV